MSTERLFYNLAQYARLRGVSAKTLYRLKAAKPLPSPLDRPGHPSWLKSQLDGWYVGTEIAALVYGNREICVPGYDTLPPDDAHARLLQWHEEAATRAAADGAETVAALYRKCADALRAAGPRA